MPSDVAAPFSDSSEARRLATLHALDLLDSEPEREFDALVALAAEMLDCPTALLTLVDRDRQWIKAKVNMPLDETTREIAFCDHTIRGADPMVIDDAAADFRFAANPLVTAPDGIRFYAGAPIHALDEAGDRQAIGALCVIGGTPRCLNDAGRRALTHLATIAETVIAARTATRQAVALAKTSERQAADLARQDTIFRQAERLAGIGSWRMSLIDQTLQWSDGVYEIHGLPPGALPTLEEALDFYPPSAREAVGEALLMMIETGEPFEIESDFVTARGVARRVRTIGEVEKVDGEVVGLMGVFQDVTERYALEQTLRRSADTDALTGISNRAAFDRALAPAMARAHVEGSPLLLVLVDLDGFKAINDTLGHTAGDDVLRAVGQALRAPWLKDSFAARLGGDEFAIIVQDAGLAANPAMLSSRLEEALLMPIQAGNVSLVSAGTVGIAGLDADCGTVRDFVHRADTLLYAAKRARVGERRRTDRRQAA